MSKAVVIRIDDELKQQAEQALDEIGLTMTNESKNILLMSHNKLYYVRKFIVSGVHMNKIISRTLLVAGAILVGMSLFYIFQIIQLNLWEDVIFRIVSVIAFIGGGIFIGLSRVLKNQDTLIQLLRKQTEDDPN